MTTAIRRVELRDLPSPDRLAVEWNAGTVCVIRTDGSPLAAALTRALTHEGWRVVVRDDDASTDLGELHGQVACFIEIGTPFGLRNSFFTAKALQPVLTSAGTSPAWFIAISSMDGRLGLGDARLGAGVLDAGIYGMIKTLRHEWPGVRCRAIDVHPALDADTAAALIVAELLDADLTLAEVGIGPGWRCTIAAGDLIDV